MMEKLHIAPQWHKVFFIFAGAIFLTANLFATESIKLPIKESIKKIIVTGSHRIEAKAILGNVLLHPGMELNRKLLSDDIKRVFNMGYFDDVSVDYDAKSGEMHFVVVEKPTIVEIVFEGNKDKKTEDLQKEISTRNLTYLDRRQLKEDTVKLADFYAAKGFFVADVNYQVEELKPGEVRVKYVIKEGRKVLIRRINVVGNKVFSDDELKKIMRTKEENWLSFLNDAGTFQEGLFEQDRALLTQYYGHKGYIKVKVNEPEVTLSADKRYLFLSFNIEEGEHYKIGEIDIDGDLIKDKPELMKLLTIKTGEIADSWKIRADVEKLTEVYADEGYFYVNVSPRTRDLTQERLVDINLFIQKGEKVYIEKIEIAGNASTRDKVIRREMLLHEGDLYSGSKLKTSKFNLDRLGYFEEVRLTTPRGSSDNKINLNIEVVEQSTGAFSIGAGFNSVESFQFIGQLQKRNLFGLGYDAALQAQIGGRTQSFTLRFVDPYFLDTNFGFNISAFNTQRRFINFTEDSAGGSVGLTYPLYKQGKERITAGLTYKLENVSITDVRQSIQNLFDDGVTSSMTTSLARDTRNKVFEASEGSLLRASAELADGEVTGENSFGKFLFEASKFYTIIPQKSWFMPGSVLGFHLNFGYVSGFGGTIPLFERFFPGGILSIRGFELRSLGPQIEIAADAGPSDFTTEKFPIGGNKQLIFNTEYLFPIFSPAGLKGVLFFDLGDAFAEGDPISIVDLRRSAGFGIRWFSPIGPLRFEWGFPFDKREDESPIVFDFTIGSLF
jgi:outer membrane protein insertion porin family